jgi:hypothetical protein
MRLGNFARHFMGNPRAVLNSLLDSAVPNGDPRFPTRLSGGLGLLEVQAGACHVALEPAAP